MRIMPEINWREEINNLSFGCQDPLGKPRKGDFLFNNGEGPLGTHGLPDLPAPDLDDPQQREAYLVYERERTESIRTRSIEEPPTYEVTKAVREGATYNHEAKKYDSFKYVEKTFNDPIPPQEMTLMFNRVLWSQDKKIGALESATNASE